MKLYIYIMIGKTLLIDYLMQPERKFDSIEYLKNGNDRQISVFNMLTRNLILKKLYEFDPIVVGTIPIDIDIESSDMN